jgi:hypothetical protein
VLGEEVRSGFNAIIQSASSDSLLLGVMSADEEIERTGLDAEIIMLVHDSVVAIVKDEDVDKYHEILDRNVQMPRTNWDESNGFLSIPGAPIGIDSDSETGGSRDYGCGKLVKSLPFLAAIDDFDNMVTPKIQGIMETLKSGVTTDLDLDDPVVMSCMEYRNEVLNVLSEYTA